MPNNAERTIKIGIVALIECDGFSPALFKLAHYRLFGRLAPMRPT